ALTGVLANDSDIDGPALSVTQFSVATVSGSFDAGSTAVIAGVGSLVINADGSYAFTPALNYNGPVPVATYTVSDGTLSSTATLSLNVAAVNDAPVGVNDSAFVIEDAQFSVAGMPGNFAAGASAAIVGIGTLQINANGSYTFTPAANYNGPVPAATYTLSDGSLSSSATLTLQVVGDRK